MNNFDMKLMNFAVSSVSTSTIDPFISAYLRSKEDSNSSVNLKKLFHEMNMNVPLPIDRVPELKTTSGDDRFKANNVLRRCVWKNIRTV